MMKRLVSAGVAAAFLFGSAAMAQLNRPTVDAPPPSGMDAISSGIGDRAVRLNDDVRAAFARGAISSGEANAIGGEVARIVNLLSYHVPRSYRERVRLRARLDALQARLDTATGRS